MDTFIWLSILLVKPLIYLQLPWKQRCSSNFLYPLCLFFLLLSLKAQPGLQEERGCSFHYLPINVQTDDLQGPFQSFLQPNYKTQGKSADMILSHGSISEGRYKEIKQKNYKVFLSINELHCCASAYPHPTLSLFLSLSPWGLGQW